MLRRLLTICLVASVVHLACRCATGWDGAALFAEKCAGCHGPQGQGTDYYQPSLAGDLPVRELARVIAETMPEGDPESCVGEEAEAIAQYVHDAFYSPLAQVRIRPPRRELSRLTVRQYQQSLVDLFAEFRWRRRLPEERGLRARFRQRLNAGGTGEPERLVLPRIDLRLSELQELPEAFRDPKAKGKKEFGNDRIDVDVTINGGLIVPTSGLYTFVIRTSAGVVLTINNVPVIDARVRSGSDPELRGEIKLVGGRVYPVEMKTSRTDADDLEVAFLWRRPHAIEEVVPERFLVPETFPQVVATTASFPPDDRSVGYVRGAEVSADWDEATTASAIEATKAALGDLPNLARRPGGPRIESIDSLTIDDATQFCERFATVAIRRPLTDTERETLVTRFFTDDRPLVEAVELSLLSVLKNPRFLYPEAALLDAPAQQRRDFTAATRLGLGLWDSLPDAKLRKEAEEGNLHSEEQVRRQAERMRDDMRTRTKLAEFFAHWLLLDRTSKLSRDPETFPDFNDQIAADMRTSLELFLEDIVWNGDGDLRKLFLSQEFYLNGRLANFLGLEAPAGDEESFSKAPVENTERAGVVSHPFTVTAFSYYRDTSPIHRGVFLARHVLGRSLRPPPEAVAPLAPELAPEMTTRQRVATQTSPGACQACHVLINDLGFTLENFDAVGRFRDRERDRPIDATGGYIATDGDYVRLNGARDLAKFLAKSEDVHRSFVTQLFEHVTKQPILAYGVETRERLLEVFRQSDFNVRVLLVEVATAAALAE